MGCRHYKERDSQIVQSPIGQLTIKGNWPFYEASLSEIVDYDSCYEIMKEEDIPEALSQEYYSID